VQLTRQRLNRATLERQSLLHRQALAPVDALVRVCALQAQEPASPYLALWNRISGFDPAALDAAFADGSIVKATLMRITLHAVHRDDHPTCHAAMLPSLRASRLYDRRFTTSGLSIADVDSMMPDLVQFTAQPRSKIEIERFLEGRVGQRGSRAWWALKTFGPLQHVPTGGPWSFGPRASFIAAPRMLPASEHHASVRRLIRRYLEGFGPASVPDVAQFTLLQRSVVRDALRLMTGELDEMDGPDGARLFDVPGGPLPPEDSVAPPRLMAMWDSVLLAYADRSRLIPPDYRRLVIRQNGDVLPTVLVDGHVAGVWRPVEGGIEATAFHRLAAEAWAGLEVEAGALIRFLAGRDPKVYRRYSHWWATLPAAEVRLMEPDNVPLG
jgi:hypothetical protein